MAPNVKNALKGLKKGIPNNPVNLQGITKTARNQTNNVREVVPRAFKAVGKPFKSSYSRLRRMVG